MECVEADVHVVVPGVTAATAQPALPNPHLIFIHLLISFSSTLSPNLSYFLFLFPFPSPGYFNFFLLVVV